MDLSISIYDQLHDLHSLREKWDRLYKYKEASFTNYTSKIALTANILAPVVAVARKNGEIFSIWAGWLERSSFRNMPFYQRTLGEYKKIVFHASFLMGSAKQIVEESLLQEVCAYTASCKYKSIVFSDIPDESWERLNNLSQTESCISSQVSVNLRPHYYADLTNPASLKKVKKLHRKSRTPDKCNCSPIEVRTYQQVNELEEFYTVARFISLSSLKTKHGYPFRETPEWLDKYKRLSQEGMLRCYVLFLENEPAAYLISYFHNNTAYFDQSNYSYKFGHYCPGIYLLIKAIESMNETEQIEHIDFGAGKNTFKQRLSTTITQDRDVHIFTPRTASQFYYRCIQCMEKLIDVRDKVFPLLRPYYFIKELKRLLYIKELKKELTANEIQ